MAEEEWPTLAIYSPLGLIALVWLLALHPAASGRVYVATALLWLWKVDRVALATTDVVGAVVALAGMAIIVFGGWHAPQ